LLRTLLSLPQPRILEDLVANSFFYSLLSRRGRDYLRPSARTTRDVRVIPFRIPAVIPGIGLFLSTVYRGLIIGVGIVRICIGIRRICIGVRIGVTERIVAEWVIAIWIRVEGKPEVSAKIDVRSTTMVIMTTSMITSAVITSSRRTATTTSRRAANTRTTT